MRQTVNIISAVILFTCLACSDIRVSVDHDSLQDFSGYRTYTFKTGEQYHKAGRTQSNQSLDQRVEKALDEALSDLGYTKVASGAPDFFVTYEATTERRVHIQDMKVVRHGAKDMPLELNRREFNPDIGDRETELGTLVVDVIDAKTSRPVWRGAAQAEIEFTDPVAEKRALLQKAVDSMFERFPRQGRS